MKNLYILFSFLIMLSMSVECQAQLTVVQGAAMAMTPQELVQEYLVGQGITVSNVTYNGSSATITSDQIGTFQTTGMATNQLGFSAGILMTSGKAEIAIGPNNQAGAGAGMGGGGDPDLNAISNSTTHDKCILEFDFIPQSDTVKFRYVFASEEFLEYCNSINDAFGFFLSGPGINGTFSNNSKNIAIMPGTANDYVTINNVCNNTLSRWVNNGGVYYQYDALTYVFTAWHKVTPCSTYHIKLAIGDAVDHILDSGTFLEKNSFSSPSVALNLINSSPTLGSTAAEGCNDITLYFTMGAPLNYAYTVNYDVSGTATNGTDYTTLPGQITFPAGEDTAALVIHPIFDGIPESPETVIVKINQIMCNGTSAADTITITDYTPMTVHLREDTAICHGTSMRFLSEVMGGFPPYTYHWNYGNDTDSLLIFTLPVGHDTVISRVNDICPNYVSDQTLVTVHPVPVANPGTNVSIPNGTSTTLSGSASGGYGNYSYFWESNPAGFTSTQQNPNTGNLYSTTIFRLTVTDLTSGCVSEPAQVIVAVAGGVLSTNPAAEPPAICRGETSTLYALPGGGSGLYTYSWTSEPPGMTSDQSTVEVSPFQTTTYHVTVNDGFNNVYGTTSLTIYPPPVIHLGPLDSTVCIYDSIKLDAGNPGSSYLWSNGADTRSITVTSAGLAFEVQTYQVVVTNENGCKDSAMINVIFSFNDCVGVSEQQAFRDFNVYPNPNDGTFHLSMRGKDERVWINIYDMNGRKVYDEVMETIPGKEASANIRLPDSPPGIYLLQVAGKNYSGTKRILIRR